jgi:hypothetical protein
MRGNVIIRGVGLLACWNPDGSISWRHPFKNGVTNPGLDYLGAAGFSNGAQIAAWYASLIDQVGFSSLNINDTMSSHAGWAEFTGFSGARPQWVNAEAGQQVASNGSFSFPITVNGIVHGMFITSSVTKGGTTGTLWATAELPSNSVVSVGQVVTGTYAIQFSGG